ncbi:MAG: ribonuclease HI [Candidatus Yonathbacteria bacterium]|nr:ribonuclease HI [Candidatus Yonathbacteria bacterium]
MNENIIIFTDGSSLGNPGPGGWGAIVAEGETVFELGGREKHTTNNRMELTAAIEALHAVKNKKGNIMLHTDSRYVIHGITLWVSDWKKRDWITKAKKPVENRDLWEKLDLLVSERDSLGALSWKHVGGHVGIAGNERADEIATSYAKGEKLKLYHGPFANYEHDIKNTVASGEKTKTRSAFRARSRVKAYSYLSLVNGVLKRHATWEECEKRVKGVRGVKFKKAISKEDEKKICTEWGV